MFIKDSFYKGKRVFVTGHTGFKGTWMTKVLQSFGAVVTGYALEPKTETSMYELLNMKECISSIIGDIRDLEKLKQAFNQANPEIVFHLAAQPLVIDSYENPALTFETNIMGTVNILECIRQSKNVKSFLNITTDKVYENKEWIWPYRENENLNGYDPYSNSKTCSELVTQCYERSFFNQANIAISTARAGNVIGGGDFSKNRILPDCIDAAKEHTAIVIRNPHSIRPYQHVLEPIFAYLMIAEKQYQDTSFACSYNIGPNDDDCMSTKKIVDLFCSIWGENVSFQEQTLASVYHEANILKLDCTKLKSTFGWKPVWNIERALAETVEWAKCWISENDLAACTINQINKYRKDFNYK